MIKYGSNSNDNLEYQDRENLLWWQIFFAPVFHLLARGCQFKNLAEDIIGQTGMKSKIGKCSVV